MINSTANMVVHAGNGSTVEAYAIPFRFDEPGWLEVTLLGQGEEDDAEETRLTAGTDYVVERRGGVDGLLTLLPVAAGMRLRIRRMTPRTQRLDLDAGTPFPAEDLERALDRLAMGVQDLGGGDGMPRKVMTLPASEGADGSPTLLVHRAAEAGGVDRRGTVLSFHPEVPGEMPPAGSLAYTGLAGLTEELRGQVDSAYTSNHKDAVEGAIKGLITELKAKRQEYADKLLEIVINDNHGTNLANAPADMLSADYSLTIRNDSGTSPEDVGATEYCATVIGDGARAQGSMIVGETAPGHTVLIGSGAQALYGSDHNFEDTALGAGAVMYGYNNVSLGNGTETGNSAPRDMTYALLRNFTGTDTTVVGAGGFTHGQEQSVLGVAVAQGRKSSAFGCEAAANGYAVLAAGAGARAEVPYPGDSDDDVSPALALGSGAESRWEETVAAGAAARTVEAQQAVALGAGAAAAAVGSLAVGAGATAGGMWSAAFSNGTVEAGAWAAQVFGYRAKLSLARGVEIACKGRGTETPAGEPVIPGARILLHPLDGVCLSLADTVLPPAATAATPGSEPQDATTTHHGTLAAGMLTFHCAGDKLVFHVSDGSAIRTAEASFLAMP